MSALTVWVALSFVFGLGYMVGAAVVRQRITSVMQPHLDALHTAVMEYIATKQVTAVALQQRADGLPQYMRN